MPTIHRLANMTIRVNVPDHRPAHVYTSCWRIAQHGLTQARAADAIGISRRMLSYYLSGAKPIPKTVWLACLGWASSVAA